jgi:hypothetical protein
MDLRWVALSALAIAMIGCAAPVMHARTGDVLHKGESRVSIATVLYVQAESSAVLQSADEMATPSGTYDDGSTGRFFRSSSVTQDNVVGPFLSIELRVAHAFFEGCEIGGMLGWVRIGAELRCALLDEREGAPFAAALSGGAAQHLPGAIGYLLSGETSEDFSSGQELRIGLDLSAHGRDVSPLLNVGLGYIHQYREILDGLPRFDETPPDLGEIYVWRDELRLSVPIGFALEFGEYWDPSNGRVIFAVVPEITLAANNRTTPRYQPISSSTVTDFEQTWAVYITVGADVEW